MTQLAHSLVNLQGEVNQRWPGRDTASDGWIGNDAHQAGVTDLDHDGDIDAHDAALKSQHNPDEHGIVHALDIDKDGIDPEFLLAQLIRHPAVWYVIWKRKIYSRKNSFRAVDYTGADDHTGHLHVSINLTPAAENSNVPWGVKEEHVPLTDAELDQIEARSRAAAQAGIRDYFTKGPDFRDLGDGAQSPPLRLLQMAATHAYVTRGLASGLVAAVAQLDDNGEVDEQQLASELAPHLVAALSSPEAVRQLSDALIAQLGQLAKLTNDEADRRERERLGSGQ